MNEVIKMQFRLKIKPNCTLYTFFAFVKVWWENSMQHLLCSEDYVRKSDKTLQYATLSRCVVISTGMLNGVPGVKQSNLVVPNCGPQHTRGLPWLCQSNLGNVVSLSHPAEHELIQHLWMKCACAHSNITNCFQWVVLIQPQAWYTVVALRMRESGRCSKREASVV